MKHKIKQITNHGITLPLITKVGKRNSWANRKYLCLPNLCLSEIVTFIPASSVERVMNAWINKVAQSSYEDCIDYNNGVLEESLFNKVFVNNLNMTGSLKVTELKELLYETVKKGDIKIAQAVIHQLELKTKHRNE